MFENVDGKLAMTEIKCQPMVANWNKHGSTSVPNVVYEMGHVMRKHVFRVSDQLRLKPAC